MKLLLLVAFCCVMAAQTQYIGPGHTTATCLDFDADGYGTGPGCTGPDADDTDATVYTSAQGITKYGTFLAFVQHLGYNPTRIWYFDKAGGNNANSCRVAAGSFDPATTPRCQTYGSKDEVVLGNAGLGGFAPGDMFLFRGGAQTGRTIYAAMVCTSANPCTFLVYPGETFSVDVVGTSNTDGIAVGAVSSGYLCGGTYPCSLHYEDYHADQDAQYVTLDGFTIFSSAVSQGQGVNSFSADHVTMRNLHVYNVARGTFFNDYVSNILQEHSVLHDEAASHCVYWGGINGVPRNLTIRTNLLYNCGLPHFQMNGRAEGLTVEDNIIYGDIGSGAIGISLMKGGGTAPGYTANIRNNLVFGLCNTALGIINYPDVPATHEFQWPINNLVVENNTFIYPRYCSVSGSANGSSAVVYLSTEGLSIATSGSAPYYYGGMDVTTGVVFRNNVLVNEAVSGGKGPFIQVHTRSSTYLGYGGGHYGATSGDTEAPDNVDFFTYGIRDPRTEAAKLLIQNNYFYSPNFASSVFLWANNCSAEADTATCIRDGGATMPTGYTALSTISTNYDATGLTSLNAANTGNVVSDADPLFVSGVSVSSFNALTYSYVPGATSPLLGVGSTTGAPSTDLGALTRPSPPAIGAYEYQAAGCSISPSSAGPYTVGQVVSQAFTALNCTASSWGATGTWPTGLSFASGTLSGTASAAGTYSATITYDTASQPMTITINDASLSGGSRFSGTFRGVIR